jgi:hypothetical protein
MVDAVGGPLRPFLHAGDEVDLVSGNHDRPLSVADLNRWVARLIAALPPGIRFAAHSSSLAKVDSIAREADPKLASILLDYEPGWDPAFTWEFVPTLSHFDRFAAICHEHGRRAVAYPTGRPILEPPLQRYTWDYGELRGHVDAIYPQTQHWSTVGPTGWSSALRKLGAQWVAHGRDPRERVVQLTLGDRDNGLRTTDALARYQEARAQGVGGLYLWWAPSLLDETLRFLSALDSEPPTGSAGEGRKPNSPNPDHSGP